jgi:hypothetical protein
MTTCGAGLFANQDRPVRLLRVESFVRRPVKRVQYFTPRRASGGRASRPLTRDKAPSSSAARQGNTSVQACSTETVERSFEAQLGGVRVLRKLQIPARRDAS